MWESFLSPLVSTVAAVTLALSVIRKQWSARNWIVLLLLGANLTLFSRGVVSGYSYGSALKAGSHFSPLLLLALLISHRSLIVFKKPSDVFIAVVLGFTLLLPTPTRPATGQSLLDVINRLPAKNRVEIPTSWAQPGIERVGPLFLPPEQVNSLTEITSFLSNAESFWDFTDYGALFFLSDHLSPTRFYATHHVITQENQQEVVADLTRTPPYYILFRSDTWWDAIAGVDRTLRSFIVSEYLLKNYHLVGKVGGFTVLEKGATLSFPVPLSFRVDLGHVPFLWGRDRIHALEMLRPTVQAKWTFSSTDDLDGWQPTHDISWSELGDEGWHIFTAGPDAQLQNLSIVLDPRSITYLALQMQVKGSAEKNMNAQLFWRSGNEGFAEERSVLFNIVPDDQDHLYLLRLASFPGWAWRSPITGLRLDPTDTSDVKVIINSMEFIQVDELGKDAER